MPIVGQFGSLAGPGFFVPGGAFESIATVTVGSGGASSITFSDIPGGYQHLQVRGLFRESRTLSSTAGMEIQVNGDTASNYAYHLLYGNGSSATASGAATQSIGYATNIPRNSETASAFAAVVIDILDYASTSKTKTIRSLGGYDGNNTNGIVMVNSSLWNNSSTAITSVLLRPPNTGAGNFVQYTTAALYGVRAP